MTRSLPEWIGANDDSRIPDRVQLRVYDRAEGKCIACTLTATSYECDHVIPIVLGGENRESNLQLLCVPCHKVKTKLDVKLKSIVARKRAKHLGITSKRATIQSRGFPRAAPQHTASRPIEKRN